MRRVDLGWLVPFVIGLFVGATVGCLCGALLVVGREEHELHH